jgi:hypothetical protein
VPAQSGEILRAEHAGFGFPQRVVQADGDSALRLTQDLAHVRKTGVWPVRDKHHLICRIDFDITCPMQILPQEILVGQQDFCRTRF